VLVAPLHAVGSALVHGSGPEAALGALPLMAVLALGPLAGGVALSARMRRDQPARGW
jgi:hypothetical protein